MNRLVLTVAAASTTLLAACGGGDIVVQAQLPNAAGEPTPVKGLEVRILPYDRDAMFDSLRAAYGTPQPEIPADLMALQDSIAAANTQWSTANAVWGSARDSLKTLNDQLARLPRTSGQYMALFRESNAQFEVEASAKRTADAAFARFDNLQQRFIGRAEELKLAREQWADAAYADVTDVIAAKLKALKREAYADTASDNGVVRRKVPAGQWWVHARYDLPFNELYWNVPVEAKGEPVQVQLTRENAQVRPKL